MLCPLLAAVLLLLALPAAEAASTLRAEHLRCEYRDNSLGIDATTPRLSWQLASKTRGQKQTAYQVWVARSPEGLASGRAGLWDSGKVTSDASTAIHYAGRPLASGQKCWWAVRVWDKDGQPAPASPVSLWQMGMLHASDWRARWIAAQTPRDVPTDGDNLPPPPYVRQAFTVSKAIKLGTTFWLPAGPTTATELPIRRMM